MSNIYKEAAQANLLFQSANGLMDVSDLFNSTLPKLDTLYKKYNKELKDSGEQSLLSTPSKKDVKLQLQFDIVEDVMKTKIAEREGATNALAIKDRKQYLLSLMANKQREKDEGMSEEDIAKELAEMK